jgi:hypothetical protein
MSFDVLASDAENPLPLTDRSKEWMQESNLEHFTRELLQKSIMLMHFLMIELIHIANRG